MNNFSLLGNSRAFSNTLLLIDKLAKLQAPILVEGETGTGKEMASRAIHSRGIRSERIFVAINCGAFPETLIESELFGHVKGAFTDARNDQPHHCAAQELDEDSCSWFRRYAWPGNVRELEGMVYRETMVCDEATLRLPPPPAYSGERRFACDRRLAGLGDGTYSSAKSMVLEQFEVQYLKRLMALTRGNISHAARLVGKERRALGKLLKKHGLAAREPDALWSGKTMG